jgi:hypothetical protein
METLLHRQRLPVPERLRLELLVDTGADTTTLNEMHMRSLGIPVRGATEVRGVTTDAEATECNTYDVSFALINAVGDPNLILPALEVIGRPFHNEMIDGLIGRDVLGSVVFTLEGPNRQFVINY